MSNPANNTNTAPITPPVTGAQDNVAPTAPAPEGAHKNNSVLPRNISTSARVKSIEGGADITVIFDKRLEKVKQDFRGAGAKCTTEEQKKAYSDLMERLEGKLPTSEKNDFTSDKGFNEGVDDTFKKMAIDKDMLTKANISEKEAKSLIEIRMLFNLTERIELEEIKAEKLTAYIKESEEKEKEFTDIKIGSIDFNSSFDEKKWKAFIETAKAITPPGGMYAKLDDNGKPTYLLKEVNSATINETIKKLGNSGKIIWHNIPTDKKKEVETQCLKSWKKAVFYYHGKGVFKNQSQYESVLSKAMPERPGDWAGWVKNIEKGRGALAWLKSNPLKELVQDVVGNDTEKLKEFWADVIKNSKDSNGNPDEERIKGVYACLSSDQRKSLAGSCNKQLEDILKQKKSLNESLVSSDSEIKKAEKAKLLAEKELKDFGAEDTLLPDTDIGRYKNARDEEKRVAVDLENKRGSLNAKEKELKEIKENSANSNLSKEMELKIRNLKDEIVKINSGIEKDEAKLVELTEKTKSFVQTLKQKEALVEIEKIQGEIEKIVTKKQTGAGIEVKKDTKKTTEQLLNSMQELKTKKNLQMQQLKLLSEAGIPEAAVMLKKLSEFAKGELGKPATEVDFKQLAKNILEMDGVVKKGIEQLKKPKVTEQQIKDLERIERKLLESSVVLERAQKVKNESEQLKVKIVLCDVQLSNLENRYAQLVGMSSAKDLDKRLGKIETSASDDTLKKGFEESKQRITIQAKEMVNSGKEQGKDEGKKKQDEQNVDVELQDQNTRDTMQPPAPGH